MNSISHNLAVLLGIEHYKPDNSTYVVAAGITEVDSEAIPYKDCEGLLILVTIGAMVAGATLDAKLQYSADGSTGWTDIAGSAQTQVADTGDDKMIAWDVKWPQDDYSHIRVAFTRGNGANTTIEALHVLKYGKRVLPPTPGTGAGQFVSAANLKQLICPEAGTA